MAFNFELKKIAAGNPDLSVSVYACEVVNAAADHGKETWITAQESIVVVNPTWPGYAKPGFGAPREPLLQERVFIIVLITVKHRHTLSQRLMSGKKGKVN